LARNSISLLRSASSSSAPLRLCGLSKAALLGASTGCAATLLNALHNNAPITRRQKRPHRQRRR
jgi:hypothetical protein